MKGDAPPLRLVPILRPYTLHELAGIVWLHDKDCLNGFELPREVYDEIAARSPWFSHSQRA